MPKARQDRKREQRIRRTIIVDAHDPEEETMGWYNYLEEQIRFPFRAKCIAPRAISPLRKGQEVEVVGLAPSEECAHELFITVPWEYRTLAVPLMQLRVTHASKATQQAVEDWQYWVAQDY